MTRKKYKNKYGICDREFRTKQNPSRGRKFSYFENVFVTLLHRNDIENRKRIKTAFCLMVIEIPIRPRPVHPDNSLKIVMLL